MPELFGKNVINDEQKEKIEKKTMKKDRVSFLFDDIIIPELKIDVSTKYDSLIEVMKTSDYSTAEPLAHLLEGKSYNQAASINTLETS